MLKYVRFHHETEHEVFILTLPPLKLSTLADIMRRAGYTPMSAGFVNFGPAGQVTTHGESVSLGLKPMPDDAQRIYLLYVHTPIGHREPMIAEHFRTMADTAIYTAEKP
jgi:hypothetical protein